MIKLERYLKRAILINVFFTLLIILMVSYEILEYKNYKFSFLIFNLFLAWIPFLSSTFIFIFGRSKMNLFFKIFIISFLGVVWFTFYPNIPYLLTDLIHLQENKYIHIDRYIFTYNEEFIIWYEFVELFLSGLTGMLMGFFSLLSIHSIFEKNRKRFWGWIFVCFISLMSGAGIYMGRFLRFNSWNLLSPLDVAKEFFNSANFNTLKFITLFGIFWFLIYFAMKFIFVDRKN